MTLPTLQPVFGESITEWALSHLFRHRNSLVRLNSFVQQLLPIFEQGLVHEILWTRFKLYLLDVLHESESVFSLLLFDDSHEASPQELLVICECQDLIRGLLLRLYPSGI